MSLYGIREQNFIFLFNLPINFLTFLAPAVINAVSDIICNCFVSVVIEALLTKPQECSIAIRVISEKLKWYIAMGVRELEVIMLFRAQVRVGGSDWATTNNQIMPIVV